MKREAGVYRLGVYKSISMLGGPGEVLEGSLEFGGVVFSERVGGWVVDVEITYY